MFNDEQTELFELLKGGYINVRYKDSFGVGGNVVESMLLLVKELKETAVKVRKASMLANNL